MHHQFKYPNIKWQYNKLEYVSNDVTARTLLLTGQSDIVIVPLMPALFHNEKNRRNEFVKQLDDQYKGSKVNMIQQEQQI